MVGVAVGVVVVVVAAAVLVVVVVVGRAHLAGMNCDAEAQLPGSL